MTRDRGGRGTGVRGGRGLRVLVVIGMLGAMVGVGTSQASTPPSGTVTVPTAAGQTVTDTWSGTMPAGSNATSDCSLYADSPLSDQHSVTVNVSAGAYGQVVASFTLNV